MKANDSKAAYTTGPIGKTMLMTAFSMLAGTLAMSGYNIADTYFVGQLGKIPLAAMGFTFPVIMLIGCVFRGLGVGVMTNAAQALGSGNNAKAGKLITSGLLPSVPRRSMTRRILQPGAEPSSARELPVTSVLAEEALRHSTMPVFVSSWPHQVWPAFGISPLSG